MSATEDFCFLSSHSHVMTIDNGALSFSSICKYLFQKDVVIFSNLKNRDGNFETADDFYFSSLSGKKAPNLYRLHNGTIPSCVSFFDRVLGSWLCAPPDGSTREAEVIREFENFVPIRFAELQVIHQILSSRWVALNEKKQPFKGGDSKFQFSF